MTLHRIFGFLAVLALVACASLPRVTMRVAPRAFTVGDYEDVYDDWTRTADGFDYGVFQDVLNVTATFESWEFRWAYVVRYARDFSLNAQERTDMLRATLADAETHHRFFVTMAGRDFRESDLTSPRSPWRVLMVDEHGWQEVPSEVERIARPGSRERAYFPSASSFRQTLRITFPATRANGRPVIADNARFAILRITGPDGTVNLRWEFR